MFVLNLGQHCVGKRECKIDSYMMFDQCVKAV